MLAKCRDALHQSVLPGLPQLPFFTAQLFCPVFTVGVRFLSPVFGWDGSSVNWRRPLMAVAGSNARWGWTRRGRIYRKGPAPSSGVLMGRRSRTTPAKVTSTRCVNDLQVAISEPHLPGHQHSSRYTWFMLLALHATLPASDKWIFHYLVITHFIPRQGAADSPWNNRLTLLGITRDWSSV